METAQLSNRQEAVVASCALSLFVSAWRQSNHHRRQRTPSLWAMAVLLHAKDGNVKLVISLVKSEEVIEL
jgi:hypothetical protein